MPVLPRKALTRARPSCNGGSGLRGVLPRARTWSESDASCAGEGFPPESRTALYRIATGGIGAMGIVFEKVGLAAEQSATRAIRAYSHLSTYGTAAPAGDDGDDAPVLLEPIPVGDELADMPATITVTSPTTPVTARFVEQDLMSPYGVQFGRSIWLFDPTGAAPFSTQALADVSLVVKEVWDRQCPDGYTMSSSRPAFFRDGLQDLVSSVCPLVPDPFNLQPFLVATTAPGVHQAFPGTEAVADGSRFPLACPVGELLAGTYGAMNTGFFSCFPVAGDITGLDDTGVCP